MRGQGSGMIFCHRVGQLTMTKMACLKDLKFNLPNEVGLWL